MSDLISRQAAIDAIYEMHVGGEYGVKTALPNTYGADLREIIESIDEIPSAQEWIPCSERLPEDNIAVIVTWVNRNPPAYYSEVKDIPYTSTAHYDNGKWWWDSCTCQEYLDEYHESPADDVHEDIEMLAWMPLPGPWGGDNE